MWSFLRGVFRRAQPASAARSAVVQPVPVPVAAEPSQPQPCAVLIYGTAVRVRDHAQGMDLLRAANRELVVRSVCSVNGRKHSLVGQA